MMHFKNNADGIGDDLRTSPLCGAWLRLHCVPVAVNKKWRAYDYGCRWPIIAWNVAWHKTRMCVLMLIYTRYV